MTSIFNLFAGPLIALGVWLAEGSPDAGVKDAWDESDRAIWHQNFSLNCLLMACMLGTFIEALLLPFAVGAGYTFSPVNAIGAFGCGCLAWIVVFGIAGRPRPIERYREFWRFEQLRYSHSVPCMYLVAPGSLVGLAWLGYLAWNI